MMLLIGLIIGLIVGAVAGWLVCLLMYARENLRHRAEVDRAVAKMLDDGNDQLKKLRQLTASALQ